MIELAERQGEAQDRALERHLELATLERGVGARGDRHARVTGLAVGVRDRRQHAIVTLRRTPSVEGEVSRDAIEPAAESAVRELAVWALQRGKERVVEELLGVVPVPRDRPQVGEEADLVTLVERIEGGEIAAPDA